MTAPPQQVDDGADEPRTRLGVEHLAPLPDRTTAPRWTTYHSPARDQRGDAERPGDAGLGVHHPRVGHLVVTRCRWSKVPGGTQWAYCIGTSTPTRVAVAAPGPSAAWAPGCRGRTRRRGGLVVPRGILDVLDLEIGALRERTPPGPRPGCRRRPRRTGPAWPQETGATWRRQSVRLRQRAGVVRGGGRRQRVVVGGQGRRWRGGGGGGGRARRALPAVRQTTRHPSPPARPRGDEAPDHAVAPGRWPSGFLPCRARLEEAGPGGGLPRAGRWGRQGRLTHRQPSAHHLRPLKEHRNA